MANFQPRWDLKADATVIAEGGQLFVRIQLRKNDDSTNLQYKLGDDQHLELTYTFTGSGETLDERDFELYVGENQNSLVNIHDGTTGIKTMFGQHNVKMTKKEFNLVNDNTVLDVYYMKLIAIDDGVWDGPETVHITLNTMDVVTITDGQISNQEAAGDIGNSTVDIVYNDTNEIWVTPSVIARGEKYTIGAVGFGSDSRLFVDAYGQVRKYDDSKDFTYPDDRSDRVFYPSYQIERITKGQIPTENITESGTILIPKTTALTEETDVVIMDTLGNLVSTGMRFNANGQLLQTMTYESDPIDGYFQVKIVPITSFYSSPRDAFYVGKRFKAYQMWVCPDDISYIRGGAKPGHLYQLKNNIVYPYVIKSEYIDSNEYAIFEPSMWNDLGVYDLALGANVLNKTRMFRALINASTGGGIDFETDANLGRIHVGEYFGHTVYPKIKASGSLVTYRINYESSPDDIRKYNIDLTADGYMVGTAYAMSQDFSANDDIKLEFDVIANDKGGATVTKRFNITIIRGFGQNYQTAHIAPSKNFERAWFASVATSNFYLNKTYYRESDDRYGIQQLPRMLLKENFISQNYPFPGIKPLKKILSNVIIDPEHGAPVPDGVFSLVMGNYKITSALDNLGNVVYDLLYRELHPSGTRVSVSMNPHSYTATDNELFSEVFGLRQNIFKEVGEDVTNLYTDPDDFRNRGLVVPAIPGLSDEMTDTVPRFMNHPYEEYGLTPQFMPILPVAYFNPGQAESFFTKLVQTNEHSALVNTEFEVHGVEFTFYTQDYDLYVQDKFIIPLVGKQ